MCVGGGGVNSPNARDIVPGFLLALVELSVTLVTGPQILAMFLSGQPGPKFLNCGYSHLAPE